MSEIFRIAARNLLRNKRRSGLSGLAILVGVGAIIFLQGFSNSFLKSVLEDQVLAKAGAIQIHKKGYLEADRDQIKLNLPLDPAFEAKLRAVPGVTAVAPRIAFEGMLSNGSVSSMFVATAIDPAVEYQVCPKRLTAVATGSQPIAVGDAALALVGHQLAESLEAQEGGVVTMMSASVGGASNALDVTVKGFLPARFITDSKRTATVTLPFAQSLLRMPGRVTEYVLGVADLETAREVAARVQAAVGDEYRVDSWYDSVKQAAEMKERMGYILGFVIAILSFLVATGIVNTMLMSVFERVREIGTMLAVGTRRRQVMALFLLEAGILGLVGALLGAVIGFAIVQHFHASGFHMKPPGGDPATFFPYIEASFVGYSIGFAVVGTMLAGLFPAWKASRLSPADALRST